MLLLSGIGGLAVANADTDGGTDTGSSQSTGSGSGTGSTGNSSDRDSTSRDNVSSSGTATDRATRDDSRSGDADADGGAADTRDDSHRGSADGDDTASDTRGDTPEASAGGPDTGVGGDHVDESVSPNATAETAAEYDDPAPAPAPSPASASTHTSNDVPAEAVNSSHDTPSASVFSVEPPAAATATDPGPVVTAPASEPAIETPSAGISPASSPEPVPQAPANASTDIFTQLHALLTSAVGLVTPIIQLPGDLITSLTTATTTPKVPGVGVARSDHVMAGPPGGMLELLRSPTQNATSVSALDLMVPATRHPDVIPATAGLATPTPQWVPDQTVQAEQNPPPGQNNTALVVAGAITAILATVSLWALFYAVLPGLGGLLAATATGAGIGYRQAKAGVALQSSQLARFAKSGPLGVVRSDSLIAVRTPTRGAREAAQRPHLQLVKDVA